MGLLEAACALEATQAQAPQFLLTARKSSTTLSIAYTGSPFGIKDPDSG